MAELARRHHRHRRRSRAVHRDRGVPARHLPDDRRDAGAAARLVVAGSARHPSARHTPRHPVAAPEREALRCARRHLLCRRHPRVREPRARERLDHAGVHRRVHPAARARVGAQRRGFRSRGSAGRWSLRRARQRPVCRRVDVLHAAGCLQGRAHVSRPDDAGHRADAARRPVVYRASGVAWSRRSAPSALFGAAGRRARANPQSLNPQYLTQTHFPTASAAAGVDFGIARGGLAQHPRGVKRMPQNAGLTRRSFLRNTGMAAFVGTFGSAAPLAAAAAAVAENGKFDFDTPYNRFGTDSTKYDQQIRTYGKDSVQVGMGIADMDFKVAPSITKALMERLQHENWGYLDMGGALGKSMIEHVAGWNKKRYGLTVNPDSIVMTTGVHPGLIAAIKAFCPPGSKVLLNTPTYNGFYGDLTYTKTLPEEVPMRLVNGRYSIDFDEFERHI